MEKNKRRFKLLRFKLKLNLDNYSITAIVEVSD